MNKYNEFDKVRFVKGFHLDVMDGIIVKHKKRFWTDYYLIEYRSSEYFCLNTVTWVNANDILYKI